MYSLALRTNYYSIKLGRLKTLLWCRFCGCKEYGGGAMRSNRGDLVHLRVG